MTVGSDGEPGRHPAARTARGRTRVQLELRELVDAVLTERAGYDRATAEGLVRVLGLVGQLHADHAPDDRGRCTACGRWRRCPVQSALRDHLAPWTAPPVPTPAAARDDAMSRGHISGDRQQTG